MNFKLIISYNGTNYHGWAVQPDNISIQKTLEDTLEIILKQKTKVYASGRTDAYVHAYNQVVNFHTKATIKPEDLFKALNSLLPKDIYVKNVEEADEKFNSRFDAKEKTYLYKIWTGDNYVFKKDLYLHYTKKLNISIMKKAAKILEGEHNFLSFSISDIEDTTRTISKIKIEKKRNKVYIYVTGTGFLRAMVRMIVGNLIDVSEFKKSYGDIQHLLDNPKKGSSITKAKACGLYLYSVKY